MSDPSFVRDLKDRMQRKGYRIFENSKYPYNLNIVGIRSKPYRSDVFNDTLWVFWIEDGVTFCRYWPITTLPGAHYLLNPFNLRGTAILVPGQYLDCYQLGNYHGYTALKQTSPVAVYRDNNADDLPDQNPHSIDTGNFGIHIHKAGVFSKIVGISSAGCQVFQKSADFKDFITLCELASVYWGNHFTYTLLDE